MAVQFLDDDFLVNTTTAGDQYSPQITALANGGFVVVWDSGNDGIYGRVYDANGAVTAADFPVDGDYGSSPPQITALADGGFAIVWSSSDNGVSARVYDATGTALGADFLVAPQTGGDGGESGPEPQITALANGDFVVTWVKYSESTDILARIYDGGTGTARGDAFPVTNYGFTPQITALANGGFVVTWFTREGESSEIRGRIFNANGNADGDDFLVNTTTDGSQDRPQITALADGGFVVTWASNSEISIDVHARVYNAVGTALGGDLVVNTTGNDPHAGEYQASPQIAALADGGFVVTWTSDEGGESGARHISARVFGAAGVALDDDFLVDTTSGSPNSSQITALANGGFVVTWFTREGESSEIRGRVFNANGNADGDDFLVNTTTDGSQDRPQITALADGGFVVTWDSVEGASREIRARKFGLTPDNQPPVITSDGGGDTAAKAVAENSTLVTTLAANDPDSDQTLTFSISGGEDASLFELRNGDELHFLAAPDFENLPAPGATSGYQVTVHVSDGTGGIDTQAIAVTVTDVSEAVTNGNGGGTLTGTSGNDIIDGQGGNDTINAGGGNDNIIGGPGRDNVNAGSGDDTIVATNGDGSLDVYAGGAGTDTLDMSGITVSATVNLALFFVSSSQTGRDALTSIENVIGGSGNDAITGNSVANRLDGRGGNDTINAGSGNDVVIGGAGNDTMNGGPGSDTFIFVPGFGNDRVIQFDANPAGGQDRLDISAFAITSGDFAARVTIADVGADTLVTIDGNAAQTIRLVGVGDATSATQADFLL